MSKRMDNLNHHAASNEQHRLSHILPTSVSCEPGRAYRALLHPARSDASVGTRTGTNQAHWRLTVKEKILCRRETQASSKVEGLRLMNGPTIQGHGVQHSDAHCLLIIDAILVPCTPTEYALLMSLLN